MIKSSKSYFFGTLDVINNNFSVAIPLLLFIIFFLTTNTYTYSEALLMGFNDSFSYYSISQNALSSHDLSTLPSHHLERYIIYVLLGKLALIFNLEIWTVYRCFIVLLMLLTSMLLLYFSKLPKFNAIATLALLLFNPYLYKMYYVAPSEASEAFFVLLLFIIGLHTKKSSFVILGIFVCCISKQTSIMLVPILLILHIIGDLKRVYFVLSLCFVIIFFLFINTQLTLHIFGGTYNNYALHHLLGGLKFYYSEFDLNLLNRFLGRLGVYFLTFSPLIMIFKFSKVNILAIVFFLIMGMQPILGGPLVTGNNIQRLLSLGAPFLLPILWNYKFNKYSFISFLCIYGLISLHHKFSFLYFIGSTKFHFLCILILAAMLSYVFIKKPSFIKNGI